MNIKHDASHVLVAGMSGMGKTTYGERYMVGSFHDRVFIYDHQGEFAQRLNLLPVYSITELRLRAQRERYLAFDFSKLHPGQLEECFDAFCEEVFRMASENLEPQNVHSLFVTDEVQKIVPLSNLPRPLKNIYQTGRRSLLDTLTLTQAPNELHNNVRVQITEAAMFKLTDENAVKFIKTMGWDTDSIMQLNKLEYNWYNRITGETRLKNKIGFGRHT
jgi:hypothetical protein